MDIKQVKIQIKSMLSDRKYNHSLGVANEAGKLAEVYGADADKAYLAGLIHDCAKELPEDSMVKKLEQYGVNVDCVLSNSPKVMHGPLGACIAQSIIGVSDPEVLDAVWFHTTGKSNMSLITKIVYIADYIEPGRTFEGVEIIRKLAYEDIDKAIILASGRTIIHTIEKGEVIHPDTIHARNYLLINS